MNFGGGKRRGYSRPCTVHCTCKVPRCLFVLQSLVIRMLFFSLASLIFLWTSDDEQREQQTTITRLQWPTIVSQLSQPPSPSTSSIVPETQKPPTLTKENINPPSLSLPSWATPLLNSSTDTPHRTLFPSPTPRSNLIMHSPPPHHSLTPFATHALLSPRLPQMPPPT